MLFDVKIGMFTFVYEILCIEFGIAVVRLVDTIRNTFNPWEYDSVQENVYDVRENKEHFILSSLESLGYNPISVKEV